MSNLGVSIPKLTSTVNTLREQKSAMQSKLSAVSDAVTALRGSWDSPAAQELSGIAKNMSTEFEKLAKEVTGFANTLDQIIQNYEKNEAKTQSMMDKVMSSFSG